MSLCECTDEICCARCYAAERNFRFRVAHVILLSCYWGDKWYYAGWNGGQRTAAYTVDRAFLFDDEDEARTVMRRMWENQSCPDGLAPHEVKRINAPVGGRWSVPFPRPAASST